MIDSKFLKPNTDKIPELMFLGEFRIVEHLDSDGKIYEVQYILYEGVKYIMKCKCTGRWMEERPVSSPKESMFHRSKEEIRRNYDLFNVDFEL